MRCNATVCNSLQQVGARAVRREQPKRYAWLRIYNGGFWDHPKWKVASAV